MISGIFIKRYCNKLLKTLIKKKKKFNKDKFKYHLKMYLNKKLGEEE